MDDQAFPGKLSLPDLDDSTQDIRHRHSGRIQSNLSLVPQHVKKDFNQPQNGQTSERLVGFFDKVQVGDTPDTEVPELDFGGGQPPRSIKRISKPPRARAQANTSTYELETFIEGGLEPPTIPDVEASPSSSVVPDKAEPPTTNITTWFKEKLRRRHYAPPIPEGLVDDVMKRFPPRAQLKVQVIDFYADRTTRESVQLGDIAAYMDPMKRPDGVQVRWIHAPLGIGLYHSSVEDIFLKGVGSREGKRWRRPSAHPRGKQFLKAGRAGWPYLETEMLNMRSMKEMRDTRRIAQAFLDDPSAQRILNKKVANGDYKMTLYEDVKWRSYHIGKGNPPTYWDTVKSDLPLLLSDGAMIMKSPAAAKQQPSLTMKRQTLQDEPEYQYSYLVRDSFRAFNRGDKTLLTLSPATGIDYLNRHLPVITEDPKDDVNRWRNPNHKKNQDVHNSAQGADEDIDDPEFPSKSLSVIGHIFKQFEFSGTSRWEYKTVEWLIVYLMTEISCTPHSMRSGYSIATILDVYDTHVNKLIEKKFEPWNSTTTEVFRAYLTALDELRALKKIYKQKHQFLESLKEDCENIRHDFETDGEDAADDERTITMNGRLHFALRAVQDLSGQCDDLYNDLSSSLESMSRLREIERDQRAVNADFQGKGILILSTITIIYLPLSFFASIFSMNVKGIAGDPPAISIAVFLAICGGIVTLCALPVLFLLWRLNASRNRISPRRAGRTVA